MKFGLENMPMAESSSPLNKNDILVTMRHSQPSTRLSPEPKRHRIDDPDADASITVIIDYPSSVPVPSKSTIAALFESALEDESGDQAYLRPAGILSLNQVLLPALALQEGKMLKRLQAKVQRDHSSKHKLAMEACRRLVRQATINAIGAVQRNSVTRKKLQQERRQQQAHDCRLRRQARTRELQQERDRRAEERQQALLVQRKERKRMLTRQYPVNQELWKEVVFLTSSFTQLEKEERMWQQVLQAEQQELLQNITTTTTPGKPASETELVSAIVQAPKDALQDQTETTVQEIVLASTRIQQGLGTVLKILAHSEQVRTQLYQTYRTKHQFAGYQGVRNPRGMIRFLSQED
jgi:hypothetical protein